MEKILGCKSAFKVKRRIGRKVENKVRPIVVKLRDLQDKDEILCLYANNNIDFQKETYGLGRESQDFCCIESHFLKKPPNCT